LRVASIDIGTNSVLLLVAEIDGSNISEITSNITEPRLGENLTKSGILSDKAIAKTISSIIKMIAIAKMNGAEKIILFGTEVFRRAKNGAEVAKRIEAETGISLKILTPEEEARLSYIGALMGLPEHQKNIVIDVGSGSTEIAWGGKEPGNFFSIPIGCVVLTEEFDAIPPLSKNKIENMLRAIDERLPFFPKLTANSRLIGVGGTITTLSAFASNLKKYDSSRVHGNKLSIDYIEKTFLEFSTMTIDEISAKIPFAPTRSSIILAGTAVFLALMRKNNFTKIIVSDRGARWGILEKYRR